MNNIPSTMIENLKLKLYQKPGHKLFEMKNICYNFLKTEGVTRGWDSLTMHENLNPIVTKEQNFDSLLFPEGHFARRNTDVFYANEKHLLRTHMTAHLHDLVCLGRRNFITVGEVFRRAEVDETHSEFFHQVTLL